MLEEKQDISRIIKPFRRGGWLVVLASVLIAVLIALRVIRYTPLQFESTVKIKLDDLGQGPSSATLYKDFDLFSNVNKIAGEVELLKSSLLIGKALEELDFGTSYYRVGVIRTQELYHNKPFEFKSENIPSSLINKEIRIDVLSDENYTILFPFTFHNAAFSGVFGEDYVVNNWKFSVVKADSIIAAVPNFQLEDQYLTIFNDPQDLKERVASRLDVVAVEKDVPVIRVSYKSEVPEKTADLLNTLTKIYIEDYINTRSNAAGRTVDFIDGQLEQVSKKLRESEGKIEDYRLKNNIINTRQETETELRKIAQLKIQLANLDMNLASLDSLVKYVDDEDKEFLQLAPNFEAFNDLLSTELIKKIKMYQAEKKDLLLKYTKEEKQVKLIDEKIKDLTDYIRESIHNTRNSLRIKRGEIEETIVLAQKTFEGLPTKEKQMVILEREFQLNQKMFNFLAEKRTEAAISEASNIAFHRIIQQATIPSTPASPKKSLLLIVAGFIGLLLGVSIVFLKSMLMAKVDTRNELEKYTQQHVLGVLPWAKNNQVKQRQFDQFNTLCKLNGIQKNQSIAITSGMEKEGKTYFSNGLCQSFLRTGWTVLFLSVDPLIKGNLEDQNFDIRYSTFDWQKQLRKNESTGLYELQLTGRTEIDSLFVEKLSHLLYELKQNFDLVIIDLPMLLSNPEVLQVMKSCDHSFYLVRSNFTPSKYLSYPDYIAQEFKITNIKLVLNGTSKSTNLSGLYNINNSRLKKLINGLTKLVRFNHV